MLFRAAKQKKIADYVVGQLQPLLNMLDRFYGGVPSGLASDKYVLGFFIANIRVAMQAAGAESLDQAGRAPIVASVLERLFGRGAINSEEIINLMMGVPTPNEEFKRGIEAALKVRSVMYGRNRNLLQNDPDYLAAKEIIRSAGEAYRGSSEDGKIGGEMLRALFLQHVSDRFQRSRE
jgi:hypothetical protein